MARARKKLGEILIGLNALQEPDVQRVVDAMGRRQDRQKFGQMALTMGLIREEHILAALAVQMELFPEIDKMSLREILQMIQDPTKHPTAPGAESK